MASGPNGLNGLHAHLVVELEQEQEDAHAHRPRMVVLLAMEMILTQKYATLSPAQV